MGIVMIVMGLIMALSCVSVFRLGAKAEIVNTKWGTIPRSETPPRNSFYLFLAASGLTVSVAGVVLLIKGILNAKKEASNQRLQPT